MAKIDLAARQKELESRGAYDVDMNEQHRTFDALDIDEGYEYLSRTWVEKVRRAVVLSVVRVVGPILTWFGQGAYTVGRRNLRALRGQGAISVCNHVHMLDTLLVKNALGPFRVYHTGSYYLLKRGELGRIFKSGGFLPVGTNVNDIKNLQLATQELMRRKKIVNFYPEHALWPRYEKLRPFKPGAFRYAVKFGVPVLPLFIEFRSTRLRRLLHMKKKVIIHILPAVYPTAVGSERARAQALSDEVFRRMKEYGARLYGHPIAWNEQVTEAAASAPLAKKQPKAPAAQPQSVPEGEERAETV